MEAFSAEISPSGSHSSSKSRTVISWLEVFVITASIPSIAYSFDSSDPFLLKAGFPWLILAPILLGSRYGFAHGFVSSLVLVAALTTTWYLGLLHTTEFPVELCVGLLITGVVTGEFGQRYLQRHERLDARCNYLQTRFDEFSRIYQLTKASHARLEQQVRGSTVSLRTSLLAVREQLSTFQYQDGVTFGGVGEKVLQIFREFGDVHMAALYRVIPPFGIDLSPVAQLGRPPHLIVSNPLLRETLKTRKTVVIAMDDYSAAVEGILAIVPLVDVHDQVWGVVAISEMPLVDFQQSTLDLLTIIGGYIGDAIRDRSGGRWANKEAAETFRYQLERCLSDVRRHQLPAGMVALYNDTPYLFSSLVKLVQTQSRGLDSLWMQRRPDRSDIVCALLPLADKDGVASFITRLESLVEQVLNQNLEEAGVGVSQWNLKPEHAASELLEEIVNNAPQRITDRNASRIFSNSGGVQGN
jgi:polysaccharide biosynthesis protein PelD